MQTARLGRSDLVVPRICLGTMTWGTQNTPEEAFRQIDYAVERGVNFMDTAELYPTNPVRAETLGGTEEIIGQWVARNPSRRADVLIATKVCGNGSPARGGSAPDGRVLRECVEASLRRLQTDIIDLYQLHWPNRGSYHFRRAWTYDPTQQDRAAVEPHIIDMLETADRLIKEGKIRTFGLSNETAWGLAQWLRVSKARGLPRVVTTQNEYNLLYRQFELDLGELSYHEDVGLLAYSPLAAGILSGKYLKGARPAGSRVHASPDLGGRLLDYQEPATAAYVEIARRHGLDPSAMAIAFCLTRPFMTSVIIGATKMEQLETAISAAEITLSEDALAEIQGVYRRYPAPI